MRTWHIITWHRGYNRLAWIRAGSRKLASISLLHDLRCRHDTSGYLHLNDILITSEAPLRGPTGDSIVQYSIV
jgi:hypothetical protein